MRLLFCIFALSVLAYAQPARAQDAAQPDPIRIGDIGAYTKGAMFALPYKRGVEMAIDDINAKGGLLGRKLELVSRDSKGDPGEALRLAQELFERDKVSFLINCDFSNTTIAVSSWMQQNSQPMIVNCSESDSIIWDKGNKATFRTNAGGYMWVSASINKALARHGDALKNKKWVSVAPNFEFGQSLVQSAHKITDDKKLGAQWVAEQWPAYGKLDAGAVIQILEQADPDVVFVPLFDADMVKFVREARKRDFIKDRIFIAPPLALPEHLEMLGSELPDGWFAIGMPVNDIQTPSFKKFLGDYNARYKEPFRNYSLNGYNSIMALAAAVTAAGSTDAGSVLSALPGLTFETPFGPRVMSATDHQASVPLWVGETKIVNGKPALANWTQEESRDHSPPDAWVKSVRP